MKLKDLAPHPGNPRKIDQWHLDALKKSLNEFGDLSGFVFNKTTGRLVGGHQRLKVLPPDAEIELTGDNRGHVKVGNDFFSYREVEWDENKEKAANIAANKHGGEWDLPALTTWLNELDAANIDMDLTGFNSEELENLMAPKVIPGLTDEDDVPEKVEPKAKLGDIYQLGNHRLMCGDSTSIDAVEKLMNGEKTDMVFTDPPYGMNVVKKDGQNNGLGESLDGVVGVVGVAARGKYKKVIGDEDTQTAKDAFNLCLGLGIEHLIFWGSQFYAESLPPSSGWIVWDKENGEGFFADGELAWTNSEKQLRFFRHKWKGMIRASEMGQKRVHPTQKPIALAEWCFENYGKPNSVLDLFGGSGSTLIACEKTNRKCFMMELDPHYIDVIITRWQNYTGQQAILLNQAEGLNVTEGSGETNGTQTT